MKVAAATVFVGLAVAAVPESIVVAARFRRQWRWSLLSPHDRGICSNCGYDLRATPEQCPECGTPVS
jgi:predicted Zn-ribbon and HTH transcriptional regulator